MRRPVAGPVEVRFDGQTFLASLRNISVSGTCVGIDFTPERRGGVTVAIGSLQLDAEIVRHSQNCVGVRFDHTLSDETFAALASEFAPTGQDGSNLVPMMKLDGLEIVISEFSGSFGRPE